jgi:hypothetical protein
MADLSVAQLKTDFNIRNRNTDNFEFPDPEVTAALNDTIDYDPLVYKIGVDASLRATPGVYSYTPSEDFEQIFEVEYDYYGNTSRIVFPYSWTYLDGALRFGYDFHSAPSNAAWPLFLTGKINLTHNDLIPSYLAEYIYHRAVCKEIDMLLADKTQRFLRNDTTMAELQAARGTHSAEASRLERQLNNRINIRL